MFAAAIRSRLILGGALLATVVASVWPSAEERSTPEVVPPVARDEGAAPARQAPAARTELPRLSERLERAPTVADEVKDLFAATSWDRPSGGQGARPAKPAAPTAPAFPYAIAGTLVDGDGLMVVFAKQNQDFVVRVGDVLDGDYRIDSIDRQSITVTYLPLRVTQVLPMGAPQ
jgi:hypothetical protein